MVIDISKITLENIDLYSNIKEYKKGRHYSEFEKEIYKKEIEKLKSMNQYLSEQNLMMSQRHLNDSCKLKRLDQAMTFMLQDLEVEKKGYSIKEMKEAYFSRTDENVFFYKGDNENE